MRRYQKWLSVGLLALTPGITLAGPFSRSDKPAPAASRPAVSADQVTANRVKAALERAQLSGYAIDIEVKNGVAVLSGEVGSAEQKRAASREAQNVPGVKNVDN